MLKMRILSGLLALGLMAGYAVAADAENTGSNTPRPNYELAERFSQKKISQMVFSTSIRPNWFKDSDRFWYEWKTSDGTQYYIVDARTGKKQPVFDMDRLAMQITSIVKDPFDARHLPLQALKLKDDKVFTFRVQSSLPEKDSARIERFGKKKTYSFEYDFTTEAMTDIIAAAVDLRRYGKALREDRKFLSMTVQRMAMKFEAISLETAYSRSVEDRLLSYIERTCGGHLTNASQAASVLHVSRRHIQRMLRKLSEEGILEHKGRGSYTISDPEGSKHCQRAEKTSY